MLILVVWSIRGARRSLRSWSRRGLLYPALAVLLLMAVGGAFETVVEATSSNAPPAGGRTYLVDGHRLYSELHWHGCTDGRALQRARRANAELGLGAGRALRLNPDLRL